jgi:hypothetical protein
MENGRLKWQSVKVRERRRGSDMIMTRKAMGNLARKQRDFYYVSNCVFVGGKEPKDKVFMQKVGECIKKQTRVKG